MRKTIAIAICVFTLHFILLTVYAHPGRTDSNGGHTNHSTGEYHYHHGYPAHDHYDMDGDGDLDCPYNFVDKTGQSSGGSSGRSTSTQTSSSSSRSASSQTSSRSGAANTSTQQPISAEAQSDAQKDSGGGASTLILCIVVFLVIVYLIFKIMNKDYDIEKLKSDLENQRKEYESKLTAAKSLYESKITATKSLEEILSRIASKKREETELLTLIVKEKEELEKAKQERRIIRQAPLDVLIGKDGMPIYWKPSPKKPYGDYTVYLNEKTGIYHVDYFCASYISKETHIFKVIDHARPCKKCAQGFFNFTSVPDWYKP